MVNQELSDAHTKKRERTTNNTTNITRDTSGDEIPMWPELPNRDRAGMVGRTVKKVREKKGGEGPPPSALPAA